MTDFDYSQSFDEVRNRHQEESTKRRYQSLLSQFSAWLGTSFPHLLLNGALAISASNSSSFFGAIEQFFGYMSTKINPKTNALYAHSYLSGFRSAISDYLVKNCTLATPDFQLRLSQYFSGHKRIIASKKKIGELPVREGKAHFTFDAYIFLAKAMIRWDRDFDFSTSSLLFFLLSWNLMHRSETIESIMAVHLYWEMDSLVIVLPKHKSNPEVFTTFLCVRMDVDVILRVDVIVCFIWCIALHSLRWWLTLSRLTHSFRAIVQTRFTSMQILWSRRFVRF